MGSNLIKIDECYSGNIVGIGGLENIVIKIGTLSSSRLCPNFSKTKAISMGIVKVAIEAV